MSDTSATPEMRKDQSPHDPARRLQRLRRLRPRWLGRSAVIAILALVVAGVLAAAISSLQIDKIGHALISANLGWIASALAVMMSSLVVRSISWREVLMAALPDTHIPQMGVTRATMIGVLGSAVFPGRLGEPSRVLVISRRLPHSTRRMLPLVAGTVFSQTLINLLALAILAAIAFTSVPFLHDHLDGLAAAIAVPLAIVALVVSGPRLLRTAQRSHRPRIQAAAASMSRLLRLATQGLSVFAKPRHGAGAIAAQLAAWALQWLSCYMVLRALHLEAHAGPTAAAAVLLAVNVSAVLPATPSNVGVFQAACVLVLAAYGVGAGPGLAYGIILQAIEVITALALGVPALLGEGMTWQDMKRSRPTAGEE